MPKIRSRRAMIDAKIDAIFAPLVKLRHMPATPMTQEEMQEQCKLVSKLAECDPGEENDG